ncbi:sensor histidine kinase [Leucobacter aridicollis]|uniref:sensor histidine kinase n=1 Tax=Leucobacter aridicollis TaxID=283878 RepID=UPI002107DCBB|nr:sensor histidine kinase [Leucobacter aridicollis]UTX52966.1 sensor histidine kinase [Leucobacter aridicollis]
MTSEPWAPAPHSPAAARPAAGTQLAAKRPQGEKPPLRIALTMLHLAALGLLGWALFVTVFALLGVGLGLTLVFGIGLLFLIALVYVLFGAAWCETERVDGLYALGIPPLRAVQQRAPGFGGFLRMMWAQCVEGRMWQAIASFAVATFLGLFFLICAQNLVWGVSAAILTATGGAVEYHPNSGLLLAPFIADLPWFAFAIVAVLCAAAMVGLALLHRVLTVWIARAGAEAEHLQAAAELSEQQRAGAVRAADLERTRLERDLHDGVQPRLVSVGMTLGLAQQQIDADPDSAKALIAEAHTSTKAAITELRQLARGINPSVLDDRGLDAALSALAGRSHVPVTLDVRFEGRCSREAETAVYFVIAESLTNASKHSRAREVRVTVRLRDTGTLWARVEDNGVGGARVIPGGGLDGITNRVLAAGGTFRLDSPLGGPTSLEVSVPCAS